MIASRNLLASLFLVSFAHATDTLCCQATTADCRACALSMSIQDFCQACVTQGLNDVGCSSCNTDGALTPCQIQQQQASQAPGAFAPQCNPDGSFSMTQCHASTGFCWCVNDAGLELAGTQQGPGQGIPDCASRVLTPCQLQVSQSARLIGAFTPQCDSDDGSYLPSQCHASSGFCWCVRPDGSEIDGTRTGPTESKFECNVTYTPCQIQAIHAMGRPGAYVPSCDSDGTYSVLQCQSGTGYCWCVDMSGVEVNGTRTGPGSKPDCSSARPSACQLQAAQAAGRLGSFRPQCEADGSYTTTQCHSSTGECWCVGPSSGAELNGTRRAPGTGLPNCDDLALTVCQQQAKKASGVIGAFRPQCENDGSFSPMQCHASTGHCWCVNSQGVALLGSDRAPSEPQPNCDAVSFSPCQLEARQASQMIGAFVPQCADDGSYSLTQCHGSTGFCWCVDTSSGAELNATRRSPSEPYPDCMALTLSPCQLQAARTPSLLGAFKPQCEADGSYSVVQCSGSTGYCWCTDVNGVMVANSSVPSYGGQPDCSQARLTPCQLQAQEAAGRPGAFIPSCTADGKYQQKQCQSGTGYCWCASEDGTEIPNTRTGPSEAAVDCSEAVLAFTLSPCQLQA